MDGLNYWWNKYKRVRDLKNEYLNLSKNCQYPNLLKQEYLDKFMEEIR